MNAKSHLAEPTLAVMSLSQNITPRIASLSEAEALHKLEMLQNLAFLIEQEAGSPENIRAYIKTMHGVLDNFSQILLR